MDQLASELVAVLGAPEGFTYVGDKVGIQAQEGDASHVQLSRNEKRIFRVEMVCVKGLFVENSDSLLIAQLHVVFRGQVLRSKEVALSSLSTADVTFNFIAEFDVSDMDFGDISSLEDSECPIMIFLTTNSVISPTRMHLSEELPVGLLNSRSLRALALFDCRLVFAHSTSYLSIELMPCEADGFDASGLAAGLLYIQLSVTENNIPQDVFPEDGGAEFANEIIKRYQSKLSLGSNENYQRAKTWWLTVRKDFPWVDGRDIKMVAHDESGQQRFVCSFIAPISPLRETNSPREAARMVSLIPFTRNIGIAGGRVNKWKSPFGLLSCLQGDIEDHAMLLCSLLLGWGMDAWVAMGSIVVPGVANDENFLGEQTVSEHTKKPHCWVVTLDRMVENIVVFWESLTGQQYEIELDGSKKGKFVKSAEMPHLSNATSSAHHAVIISKLKDKHPFAEVFALFRHDQYLLNIQRCPFLSTINCHALLKLHVRNSGPFQTASFDVADHRSWLRFPFESSELLRHPGATMRLCSTALQTGSVLAIDIEQRIENAVKDCIFQTRRDIGLQTKFDDMISISLSPAIVSYELDRAMIASVANGSSDFQCSVRRLVSRGECFKAYPTCFSHVHIPSILALLTKANVAKEIITARSTASIIHGGSVLGQNSITRHGVRVKVFVYPEGLCAVWLMIAVCYFDGKDR